LTNKLLKCRGLSVVQAISTALFAHQKQALSWMIRAENNDRLPPFWQQRGSYYYNSLTSFSSPTKPHSIRGGTLLGWTELFAVVIWWWGSVEGTLHSVFLMSCMFMFILRSKTRHYSWTNTRQCGLWTEFQLGVSTMESQLGDMTWSFANQGRRFQIWHFLLEILTHWPHYPPNSQILLYKYCFFAWNTLLPSSHMHMCYKIIYTTWVRGVACQKQRLGPKLEGAALGEHPKNWGPPTYFCNRWSKQLQIWYTTWVWD